MARQGLHEYSWPGNIRELSHLLERGVLLCRNNTIDLADLCLPLPVKGQNSGHEPQQKPVTQLETGTLAEVEETVLLQRLRHYDGNAVKAAESLGLSRSAFYRRLDKLKICHE